MFRRRGRPIEFFLVHPGGPYFAGKTASVWSIPKGEYGAGEDPVAAAKREFLEETGQTADRCGARELLPLGSIRQPGGKEVSAWGFEGDWPEGEDLASNTFELEWPPRSGRRRTFPEVDEARFFAESEARLRIHPAQIPFIGRLIGLVDRAR